MKSPIEQEIEWCEAHMGESNASIDFEKGFIAGLKQALRFEKEAEKILEVEGGSSLNFVTTINGLSNMLIEAAGKGYVSSNDLDYANDCLDKIIPLLSTSAKNEEENKKPQLDNTHCICKVTMPSPDFTILTCKFCGKPHSPK